MLRIANLNMPLDVTEVSLRQEVLRRLHIRD